MTQNTPAADDAKATFAAQLQLLLDERGTSLHDRQPFLGLLAEAMDAAHAAALATAEQEWAIDYRSVEQPARGWIRSSSVYRTEQEARESVTRDMRGAGLSFNSDLRYRIVPMLRITGSPILIRYQKPTTYQATITSDRRNCTVRIALVDPEADRGDAPYKEIKTVLSVSTGVAQGSDALITTAEQVMGEAGWSALVSWRDLPGGDFYTFVEKG